MRFLLCITFCFIHFCALLYHDALPFINLLCPHFDRADLSQLWQIVVPTVRSRHVLYQALGSEQLSLPWGFLSEMFRNRSKREHVRTEAVIRFVDLIGLFTARHHVNANSQFQYIWWPESNILLVSTCVFGFDTSHRWWCDASLWACSLFKTSLITMRIVQH